MDKISIIVPVYNAEKSLGRCLQSLQNQTHTNIEVIMVDDGSSDQSLNICLKYSSSDKRFQYIRQTNAGVSAARNKGISIATGEYIGFCDSDDWVEADMYETLVKLLETEKADASVVHFYTNDNIDQFVTKEYSTYCYSGREAVLQIHMNRLSNSSLWNKLFKRDLFKNVRLDEKITNLEDMLAVWDLFIQADKVVYTNIPKYHYYVHEKSLSSELKESYWTYRKAVYAMKAKMEKIMPENVAYAQRTIILSACWGIEKLIKANRMKERYYGLLQNDINTQYTKEVKKIFSSKERLMIRAFSFGSHAAVLCSKVMALNRRLKRNKRYTIDG